MVGTGLGLAITYNLCRIMGGSLWYTSVYGEGSTFSVSIPFSEVSHDMPEDETTETADFTAPDAKVLVVDDIEINLAVAEALLSTFEIRPDLAQSGAEAIEMCRRLDYDIVFMDHMMPGMDGLETTGIIRELGGHNITLPIIALTANAIMGVEEMFLENKLNGLLPKPVDITAFNRCLRQWLPQELIVDSV